MPSPIQDSSNNLTRNQTLLKKLHSPLFGPCYSKNASSLENNGKRLHLTLLVYLFEADKRILDSNTKFIHRVNISFFSNYFLIKSATAKKWISEAIELFERTPEVQKKDATNYFMLCYNIKEAIDVPEIAFEVNVASWKKLLLTSKRKPVPSPKGEATPASPPEEKPITPPVIRPEPEPTGEQGLGSLFG
jgi:hypothetical protein